MSFQSLGQVPQVPTPRADKSGVIGAASKLRRWARAAFQTGLSWCYAAVDSALGIELREEERRYLNRRSPKRPDRREDH